MEILVENVHNMICFNPIADFVSNIETVEWMLIIISI